MTSKFEQYATQFASECKLSEPQRGGCYKIKHKGKFVLTCSGKSSWGSLRAAKGALNLELDRQFSRVFRAGPATINGIRTWSSYEVIVVSTKELLGVYSKDEWNKIKKIYKEGCMKDTEFVQLQA